MDHSGGDAHHGGGAVALLGDLAEELDGGETNDGHHHHHRGNRTHEQQRDEHGDEAQAHDDGHGHVAATGTGRRCAGSACGACAACWLVAPAATPGGGHRARSTIVGWVGADGDAARATPGFARALVEIVGVDVARGALDLPGGARRHVELIDAFGVVAPYRCGTRER